MASMDPYCVYDTIQEACVGINSANRNAALQNVTGGIANCPPGTGEPNISLAVAIQLNQLASLQLIAIFDGDKPAPKVI